MQKSKVKILILIPHNRFLRKTKLRKNAILNKDIQIFI